MARLDSAALIVLSHGITIRPANQTRSEYAVQYQGLIVATFKGMREAITKADALARQAEYIARRDKREGV